MNELFRKQATLQELLNEGSSDYVGDLCHKIKNMAFFLNQEVVELVEEIAGTRDINKPWKANYNNIYHKHVEITDKVRSEAIDVLKFAMNICLLAGITPENVDKEFDQVHKRNVRRIDDGY